MAIVKYSRQREIIKKNLVGRKDHPTADMIYGDIHKEYPNISLGTVYRNLSLLYQLGDIQKLSTADGPDRFDGNTAPHDHFTCKLCGHIMDLPLTDASFALRARAAEGFAGRIEEESVQFYGVCPGCLGAPEASRSV